MDNFSTLSTYGESSNILTTEDIQKAVSALKEISKLPYLTCIKSRHEWYKTIEKNKVARDFMLFGGIPVIKDKLIPKGKVRFEMSDGTYNDYDITPVINYLKYSK